MQYLKKIGKNSRKAFEDLKNIKHDKIKKALNDYSQALLRNKKSIIRENQKDVKNIKRKQFVDRLLLNDKRIQSIRDSINEISKFKNPVGRVLEQWVRPNKLKIKKISTPIGIIGVIYESRPNVTSDVAGLCFKSGNAVILKGGSEAINTNRIFAKLFKKTLKKNKVDENFVQFIDTKERKVVDIMLSKMKRYIDVIIPRGGKNLVKKVQEKSKVPIIGHLEGICHTYIDDEAELKMAKTIIYNAKLRNTSICGATETILMHKKIVKKFCNPILNNLEDKNCKIYGDKFIRKYYQGKIYPAKEKDWSTEYLNATVSVKVVRNVKEAIKHINKYGTNHTDSIITKNKKTANQFLKNVKSSIAMHNTSTQFADGGEFGFGGEVGISTNTLPPRGPVGLEQLVSYKYEISSKGKIRK